MMFRCISWCLSTVREYLRALWGFLRRSGRSILGIYPKTDEDVRPCTASEKKEMDIPVLLIGSSIATRQFAEALIRELQEHFKELKFPFWTEDMYRHSTDTRCVLAICGIATRVMTDLKALDYFPDDLQNMVLVLLHYRKKEEISGYVGQYVREKYPSIGHIYEFDFDVISGHRGIYQSQVNDESLKCLHEVLRQKMAQRKRKILPYFFYCRMLD